MNNYIVSTPFVPAGFNGLIEVRHYPIATIRDIISRLDSSEYTSYVGHQTTADYLGVPYSRGRLMSIGNGDTLYGIRLIARPQYGVDIPVDEEHYLGFIQIVKEVSND